MPGDEADRSDEEGQTPEESGSDDDPDRSTESEQTAGPADGHEAGSEPDGAAEPEQTGETRDSPDPEGGPDQAERPGRETTRYVGIALALLLAVVVAAAIGAYVSNGGGDSSAGPDATFESSQYTFTWEDRHNRSQTHRQLRIDHVGGESVAHGSFDFVVNGNDSVWGSQDQANVSSPSPPPEAEMFFPNIVELPEGYADIYPDENAQWESGEYFVLMAYGGLPEGSGETCVVAGWRNEGAQTPENMSVDPNCQGGEPFQGLQPGDELVVEWESDSGEQTATIYNATVE